MNIMRSLTCNYGRRAIIGLSTPERGVLQHLAIGCKPMEIAAKNHRSIETVRDHIANAKAKLGAKTTEHAVAIAVSQGLVAIGERVMKQNGEGKPL